jgi:hypothetical protein
MPVSWMVLMEVSVHVPEGAVIGLVFPAAVEAFVMSAAVGFAQVAVELPVLHMIAEVIMGQRRRRGQGERKHGRRYQSFIPGHG